MSRSTIIATGVVGLIGAALTGTGEFLLHFDDLARFGPENQFFIGISEQRTTLGHFFGVLGAPLYLVGCWHMYLMLKPASPKWALAGFFAAAYGFVIGAVWIGSRASISALVNTAESGELLSLMELYDLRYETLLGVTRIAVLLLSAIFIWLTLTGRSHYPKWMALLNPILLLVASFVVFVLAPEVGKYVMPIALNVAFFIFFAASIMCARKSGV